MNEQHLESTRRKFLDRDHSFDFLLLVKNLHAVALVILGSMFIDLNIVSKADGEVASDAEPRLKACLAGLLEREYLEKVL